MEKRTAAAAEAQELLRKTTVGGYCADRSAARELGGKKLDDGRTDRCVPVSPEDSIAKALRTLANNEISSAPVFDKGKFHGFFDMNDIIESLTTEAAEDVVNVNGPYTPMQVVASMDKLTITIAPAFMNQKVFAVSGNDGELAYRGYRDSTLLDIVNAGFLNPLRATQPAPARRVCHRIGVFDFDPMFDSGSTVYNVDDMQIISQMDVMRFLFDNADKTGSLKDCSLTDLGVVTQDGYVMTVNETVSALDTFAEMYAAGLSAVAIVNDAGKLVQNFSASDMRWLETSSFGTLALPSVVFLSCMASCRDPGAPITCKADASLGRVMELMIQNEIHHIHVVDDDGYPKGIVTPTDVMKLVAAQPPEGL